jgi:hypothetical protein
MDVKIPQRHNINIAVQTTADSVVWRRRDIVRVVETHEEERPRDKVENYAKKKKIVKMKTTRMER